MRRWRRAAVWVINGKHRKCVWTGRYIKKLHLKTHQSHNWSRRGFIYRNFMTQVHVSNSFSPSSLPSAPSAPWNEQPFFTVFLLLLCQHLTTSSVGVCRSLTLLQPFRQQQLWRQIDVLSTPLLSSRPQGDAADVDVIVWRGAPPGCVAGWRASGWVNAPLGSINLQCDG